MAGGATQPDRSRYRTNQATGFDDELRRMGNDVFAGVVADLQAFRRDWMRGLSTDELLLRWDYKVLHGPRQRRCGLMQIKVFDRKYRVLLIDLEQHQIVVFLIAFRRSDSNSADIGRGLARAYRIREELNDW